LLFAPSYICLFFFIRLSLSSFDRDIIGSARWDGSLSFVFSLAILAMSFRRHKQTRRSIGSVPS
jgi:hypothetical protein